MRAQENTRKTWKPQVCCLNYPLQTAKRGWGNPGKHAEGKICRNGEKSLAPDQHIFIGK
jgi:hypothetical protein